MRELVILFVHVIVTLACPWRIDNSPSCHTRSSWRTGYKRPVAAALAKSGIIVDYRAGNERIVALCPRDPGVTLPHPRGILGEDHVELFPPSGCQPNVSDSEAKAKMALSS